MATVATAVSVAAGACSAASVAAGAKTTDLKPDAKPAQDDSAHYLLQAGAFQASGDAEAVKAKIALLGLSARVESAQAAAAEATLGVGEFRCAAIGPHAHAEDGLVAGLPAMAIKAR